MNISTDTANYYSLMTEADAEVGFEVIFKGDKSRQWWALSITTSADYVGTTATAKLEWSVDGENYIQLVDANGVAISYTLEADSTIIVNNDGLYKTGTFKVIYDEGDASAGTLDVRLSDGR